MRGYLPELPFFSLRKGDDITPLTRLLRSLKALTSVKHLPSRAQHIVGTVSYSHLSSLLTLDLPFVPAATPPSLRVPECLPPPEFTSPRLFHTSPLTFQS